MNFFRRTISSGLNKNTNNDNNGISNTHPSTTIATTASASVAHGGSSSGSGSGSSGSSNNGNVDGHEEQSWTVGGNQQQQQQQQLSSVGGRSHSNDTNGGDNVIINNNSSNNNNNNGIAVSGNHSNGGDIRRSEMAARGAVETATTGRRRRRTVEARNRMEFTSNMTRDDDEDEHGNGMTAAQRGHSHLIRSRPELYPKFVQEQLRTTHNNWDTLIYTRQTLERIEDIRLESRNLLTQLWHQHVYLVPEALTASVSAAGGIHAVLSSLENDTTTMVDADSSSNSDSDHMQIVTTQRDTIVNDTTGTTFETVTTIPLPNGMSLPPPPLSNSNLTLKRINYNDNSRYEGELDQHRVRQGHGTYFYPSGTVYRGQWNQGSRHGLGICEFVSGNKYVGYWNQGRREGRGVFMFIKYRNTISDLPIPGVRKPKPATLNAFEQSQRDNNAMAKFGNDGVMVRISSGNAQLRLPTSMQRQAPIQGAPQVSQILQHGLDESPDRLIPNVFEVTEMAPSEMEPEYVIRKTPTPYDITSVPNFIITDPQLLRMIETLLSFEDQERYEGEFKHDQRHGFGVYYFPDGSCYSGMWKHNRRHGKGTYFFTSGRIYEGEWLSSMRHGNGVMRDVDGHVMYTGQWANDRKDGIGTQFENGDWNTAVWSANRIEKWISVQLFPFRANLRKFLFSDYIPGVRYDSEELVIREQLQHIELAEEEDKQADPEQQDMEPPDVQPVLLPFQNFFRDATIITQR